MKQRIYYITTINGESLDELPFLKTEEIKEFNHIGYCGKNHTGQNSTREKYLNSLNKGQFTVRQTKFDENDLKEKFIVTRKLNLDSRSITLINNFTSKSKINF